MINKFTYYLMFGDMFVESFASEKLADDTYRVTKMHLNVTQEGCLIFHSHEEAVASAHHQYFKICRESLVYELFELDGSPIAGTT